MKNFLLKSILLVSHREKKAKKVEFDPKMTVIKGTNDTGKSSLIKSIYLGFGAEPPKVHRRWVDANVISLIRFSVDERDYSILRAAGAYSLFDEKNELLGSYTSVTNELAPALAKLFGFRLRLVNRGGDPCIPPPAYFFLPFYIDQDEGWVKPWQSFTRLSQFSNWRQPVISYHFGLRPDRWYELDADRRSQLEKKEVPQKELMTLVSLGRKTKGQLARVDFDLDVNAFKEEISELLDVCNQLRVREEKYRNKIVELRTEKIRLDAQIEIVTRTREELSADYSYADTKHGDVVGCPICGQEYENSFSERFEIAKDEETCSDLLQSLRGDLYKVIFEITEIEGSLSSSIEEQKKVDAILSKKQGEVMLADLVKIEGKKELLAHLEGEIELQQEKISEVDIKISQIDDEMEEFEDSDRRAAILGEHESTFRQYASKLSVHGMSEDGFSNIYAKIEETGSDQPRAVLAYQFSVLNAISKKEGSIFCPVVIDAPNQQEQDRDNLKKILEFIPSNCPVNGQLILGLVDDCNLKFNGKVVELTTKFSLLDESFYASGAAELRGFESVQFNDLDSREQ